MSRHQNRVEAIQLLYNIDVNNSSIEDAVNQIYHDNEVNNEAVLYVNGVILSLADIDNIISKNLENYSLSRLNPVDRAIFRLATYEMNAGTATGIVINEALELTKEFSDTGDNKMVRFTNKVLDQIAKSLAK